jgi:hypothetical protein
MNKEKDILKKAIDENMDKVIEKIPEEKEIKEEHIISEETEKEIGEIKDKKYNQNKKGIDWKQRWWYLATPLAAGFILIIVVLSRPYIVNNSKSASEFMVEMAEASNETELATTSTGMVNREGDYSQEIAVEAEMPGAASDLGIMENNVSVTLAVSANEKEYKEKDIIYLTIINYTSEVIGYEEAVSLEIEKDGKWEEVPLKEDIGFIEIWNIIEAKGSGTSQVDLDIFQIEEVNENYRLVKMINGEEINIYFRIVDGM